MRQINFQAQTNFTRNNISQHEENIISVFSKREDFFFTKTDKGGATVILDEKDYIEKLTNNQKMRTITKKSAMI